MRLLYDMFVELKRNAYRFSCGDDTTRALIIEQEWNETKVVPRKHFGSVQKHIFKG